jgi:hypothetical protein
LADRISVPIGTGVDHLSVDCVYPDMNTPFDHPVLINWGSNRITCDRDDLEPLVDAMEDEHTTPNGFLHDAWMPFLRQHANKP